MKERYTKGEILYFSAYIVYFTVSVLGIANVIHLFPFSGVLGIMKICSALIVLLKIVWKEDVKRDNFLIFLFLISVVLIVCVNTGNFDLFCCLCFGYGMKDISYRTVLKISIIIQICVMFLTAVAIYGGLIQNEMVGTMVWTNTVIDEEAAGRYNLGYSHPNAISAIVLFTTLMYMCVRKKCTFFEGLLGLIINYLIYQKTGSRTCFLITIMFIPLMFYFLQKRKLQEYWKWLLRISPIFITLTAVFSQLFYDETNNIFLKINSILSGRLSLGHHGLMDYGITLFGQKIAWVGSNIPGVPYNFVDCSYVRILLDYGIIIFVVVFVLNIITMFKLVKLEEKGLCIAFLAFLVHNMIEPTIFTISIQPFFLLMGQTGFLDFEHREKEN